ncbi:MAG TPA: cupredoxin domain-containing protein [Solirubrobacteraceae bacterium]|nr:cupredoxin domain-containing protein [Solirubrobacteraceae bacterium]
MPARRALLVTLALAAPALAGCGEDDPVRIEGHTLHVRLEEFRIVPEDVRVTAGRLRIVATNQGRLTHNLKVVRLDEEDREAPPTELGGTGTAQPGETASFTFEDLEPGEYRMVCTITNHDDLGQYGELYAEEEGS